MAKLNIGGTKVIVSDDFLKLSPEQQQATVEEIAASLGPSQAPGNAPSSPEYDAALSSASRASQMFSGAVPPRDAQTAPGRPDLIGATAATLGGIVQGIPVVGPMVQNASDALIGTGAQLTGGDYGETVQGLQQRRAQLAAANPIADIAGQVGGGIGAYGGAATVAGGARALGLTGGLGTRVGNSALSGAGIAAADAAVKGNDPLEAGVWGGALGGAVPLIGSAIGAGARAIGNRIAPIVNAATNPAEEAARRVGVAVGRDRAANQAMTAADEAVARSSGVPLTNVDRGGETARALARSVANQNPEARATLSGIAQERYKGQSGRAVDFIRNLTGGKVDDLAYQENLRKQADLLNDRNYKAAERSPRAQAVFTAELQELMQSPSIQRAIDMVGETGKDIAAISGQLPVQNPFRKGSDGVWRLVQKADGTLAVPSLRFWDQVKRNLDPQIEQAMRGAKPNKYQAGLLKQIKDKLVNSLDSVVPEYRTARQGAAAAFGAEDAIEAGKVFARSPGQIPEATRAFTRFNAAEKEAFATGYASELIDRIKVRGDSQNVIKSAFESPAAREMNELVFGKAKATQLEAYVRVEALADALRNSLGNSTTARQLVELGIGGGAGFALSGDWQGALTGAVLAKGTRYAGEKIDARVMENVAKLLTSGTRADLDKAVANATLSPAWLEAIKMIEATIAVPARAAGVQVAVGQS